MHPGGAAVEQVGGDHRGLYARMAEELRDRPDVVAVFEQVGGEAVAKGVAARPLHVACGEHRSIHGVLHLCFVRVVASLLAGFRTM